MNNIEIDVVIPTKNRSIETTQAIHSVLNQTYPVKQIIVIDDGSEATQLGTLKRNFDGNPKVRIHSIAATNHPGRARNVGLKFCTSNWVALLDSDDFWLPNKIEMQVNDIVKHADLMAFCSNATKSSRIEKVLFFPGVRSKTLSTSMLLNNNLVITSSAIVHRNALNNVGGFASSYSVRGVEDFATWLRISVGSNWFYNSTPMLIYADIDKKSVRFDKEFEHTYEKTIAQLDFLRWCKDKNRSIFILSRMGTKLLGQLMKFEYFIHRCLHLFKISVKFSPVRRN